MSASPRITHIPTILTESKTASASTFGVEKPIKSLLHFLNELGMVFPPGNLRFHSGLTTKPLEGLSLIRWQNLLKQKIRIEIGPYTIDMTQGEYVRGFHDYLEKTLGKSVDTFLRGSYALYVVNMPAYFQDLVDEFLLTEPFHLREGKRALLAPILMEMKREWEEMKAPTDVDWVDLVECPAFEAKLLSMFFLGQLEGRLNPSEIQKAGFKKLVETKPTYLKVSKKSFLIASLNTEGLSVDRVTGDIPHASIASWCNIFVPIESIPTPKTFLKLPQVVADWGIKCLRVEARHGLNFPALATFCQYLYQGFELMPGPKAIQEELFRTCNILSIDKAYKEFTDAIEGRIFGHSIEPISFLFSVALQLHFTLQNMHEAKQEWPKLWKYLLSMMREHTEKNSVEENLIDFFEKYQDDFQTLLSGLVHLSMGAALSPTKTASIFKITEAAVILRVGNSHLYLRKDLYEEPLKNQHIDLEKILASKDLKFTGKPNLHISEVVTKYVKNTSTSIGFNPYVHFVHFYQSSRPHSPSAVLKSSLPHLVDPKTPQENREILFERMSIWYPKFNGKKSTKGLDVLALIARDDLNEAFSTLESLGELKKHYLGGFLGLVAPIDPARALGALIKSQELSNKERFEVLKELFKNGSTTPEVLIIATNYIKTLSESAEYASSVPFFVRKLWQTQSLRKEGTSLLLHCIEKTLDLENLLDELLRKEDATTCYLLYLHLPKHLQLPKKLTERFEELQVLSRELQKDEKDFVERVIVSYLEKENFQEAYVLFKRFLPLWDQETYVDLFCQIFEKGQNNSDFIVEALHTLKTPFLTGLQDRLLLENFTQDLLQKNLKKGVTFLFHSHSLALLKEAYPRLKDVAFKQIEDLDPVPRNREATFLLSHLIQHSIEGNLDCIAKVLNLLASNWTQDPGTYKLLKNLLKENHESLAVAFNKFQKISEIQTLQTLLNLLKIESADHLQEIFLKELPLELFVASLQNQRFPHPTEEKKHALITAAQRSKLENREEYFRFFTECLSQIPLSQNELSEVKCNLGDRSNFIEILLDVFSENELFITMILTEEEKAVRQVEAEKLCRYVKKWSEAFQLPETLHPILEFLLNLRVVDVDLILQIVKKTRFHHFNVLRPFLIQDIDTHTFKRHLDLFIELDSFFNENDPEYLPFWDQMMKKILTLSLPFDRLLSFAGQVDFLSRTGTISYRGRLLQKAVLIKLERFSEILKIWKELPPSSEFYAVLEIFIPEINDEDVIRDVFNHIQSLRNISDSSLLQFSAYCVLRTHYEKFKQDPEIRQTASTLTNALMQVGMVDGREIFQDTLGFITHEIESLFDSPHLLLNQFQSLLQEALELLEKHHLDTVDEALSWQADIWITVLARAIFDEKVNFFELFIVSLKLYTGSTISWGESGNREHREIVYRFTEKFLKRLKEFNLSNGCVCFRAFLPLAEFFIQYHQSGDSTDHLKLLFYLGLAVTPLAIIEKSVTKDYLRNILPLMDQKTHDFRVMDMIVGDPKGADDSSSENTRLCDRNARYLTDHLLTIFPSNNNLRRIFLILKTLTKEPLKDFLSSDYYLYILNSFERVFLVDILDEDLFEEFRNMFFFQHDHLLNPQKSYKIVCKFLAIFKNNFRNEFLKNLDTLDYPCELISKYIQFYIDVLSLANSCAIFVRENSFSLLLTSLDFDDDIKDRIIHELSIKADEEKSVFRLFTLALVKSSSGKISEKKELADWLYAFFRKKPSEKAANEYLEDYLHSLHPLTNLDFETYLKYLQACFPVNRDHPENLTLIANAILEKPRQPTDKVKIQLKPQLDKKKDSILEFVPPPEILDAQARTFVNWVYPFYLRGLKKEIGPHLDQALRQGIFVKGFKHYWHPQ